jgi:hypothetical protein
LNVVVVVDAQTPLLLARAVQVADVSRYTGVA